MPPVPATRHFEILSAVLALAEERTSIPLAEAAAEVGVPVDQLRTLLEPVLFLEFRDGYGEIVGRTDAFFLDERDVLQVASGHWLRDWDASEPSRAAALRLLVAATIYQATGPRSDALDSALEKLRQVVAIDMVLPLDRPPCLDAALDAHRRLRSLRFRYVKWKDDTATDREVLPFQVYSQWGHWYVDGPEVGSEVEKQWRIDRMDAATLGDVDFSLPETLARPEWFDLSEHEHCVTLRVPTPVLAALPQPHEVVSSTEHDDGTTTAELSIAGDRHLDHILVALGPEGVVVEPAEYGDRRREWAQRLLDGTR